MTKGLPAQRRASALSWAFLLGALGWVLVRWMVQGARAIAYPFELDYGEGIVWEQARLLFSSAAYGPIDRFPAIVFHYPPLFHAITVALSRLWGADMLAVGRALSLFSTVGAAVVVGVLVAGASAGGDRKVRLLAVVAAALAVFACAPVMVCSPLMRVDMMAMLFAFLGIALGIHALRHERLMWLAALSFVLAVYTKQISIAAPLALFPVLCWLRPRLAIRGLAVCIVSGLVALAGLEWATSVGFGRHVFLYNVNRLNLRGLTWIAVVLVYHALHFGVAASALRRVPAIGFQLAGLTRTKRDAAVGVDLRAASLLVLGLYWMWTTLMTVAVAKSGASINYLSEWTGVTIVWVGLGLNQAAQAVPHGGAAEERAAAWATIAPLALGIQVVVLHALVPMTHDSAWSRERIAENMRLSELIRAADKPIISDNMVLLVRNRQPVLWEPAIFTELASVGLWDEEPLVSRIRAGEFAMFITAGTRGTVVFDNHYNPRVADAMDVAYPVKTTLQSYTLHLPAGQSIAP
jgi:hypothetical protein